MGPTPSGLWLLELDALTSPSTQGTGLIWPQVLGASLKGGPCGFCHPSAPSVLRVSLKESSPLRLWIKANLPLESGLPPGHGTKRPPSSTSRSCSLRVRPDANPSPSWPGPEGSCLELVSALQGKAGTRYLGNQRTVNEGEVAGSGSSLCWATPPPSIKNPAQRPVAFYSQC